MRQQICRVVMMLACLAGFSCPALANGFSCGPGSFLSSVGGVDNFEYANTAFGEVCVTLTDQTHALIQAETFNDFVMFSNGALGLEVNSQGFDIFNGLAGITAAGVGGPSVDAYTHVPFVAGNNGNMLDGLGRFDLTINLHDGPNSGATLITFTLVNTAGTWANVSSVLAANANGNDAAMQIAECTTVGVTRSCTGLGFAAELFTDGRIVPQPAPEPGILGLLGIALLAMGFPALRRRMA